MNDPFPITSKSFDEVFQLSREIKSEIAHLDRLRDSRLKKFNNSMNQYKTYIKKQNDLLDKNSRHCEQRNKWYRYQIDTSWKNGISNRHIILRSVARTNVLKKDLDEWLGRIDENTFKGQQSNPSFVNQSHLQDEYMEGSQLIDKYNEILMEYGHRI